MDGISQKDNSPRSQRLDELPVGEALQALLNATTDMAMLVTKDGVIIAMNDAMAQAFNSTREEMIGTSTFPRHPEALLKQRKARGEMARRRQEAIHFEDERAGRLLQNSIFPVFDKKGDVTHFAVFSRDITERKKSEERLRKSLKLADDLLRTIPSGIYVYEYNKPNRLILIDANKEAERLAGRTLDDWKGKEFNEIWPAAKKLGITDDYLAVAKTGKTHESESTLYLDDKLQGIFRVRAFALPDDKIAVAFENITEAKQAEQELKATKNQLQSIMNSTKELIIAVDKDGVITTWNNAARLRTGHQPAHMIGTNTFLDDLPPGLSSLFELLRATITKKRSFIQEHSIKDADGNRIIVRSSTSRMPQGGAVIVSHDITGERTTHEQLKPGRAYYVSKEPKEDLLKQMGAFTDIGYEMLITTRDAEPQQAKHVHPVRLSGDACATTDDLKRRIAAFLDKRELAVIILSRLEYYTITEGFTNVARFLIWFHDEVRGKGAIGIVHKGHLSPDEKAFLQEEFDAYPETETAKLTLDPRRVDVLKFIEERNELDTLVNYTAVIKQFNLARMTARTWLRELQQLNLVTVKQAGKVKRITLTAKGKDFLRKHRKD